MSELKPCPFCGGEAELCYSEVDTFCRKCNVMQETEMWNTRPIEDALNKRIAELEATVEVGADIAKAYENRVSEIVALSNETVGKLNFRIAELEAAIDQLTAHDATERKDDKSPNDTQTSTIVCGKENEMRVFKDGNAWCFVLPDFQDLQVSSSVWMKEGVLDKIYKELRSVRNE